MGWFLPADTQAVQSRSLSATVLQICREGEALTILPEPTDSLGDTKSTRKEGNGVTVPTAPLWNQLGDSVFVQLLSTQMTCQRIFLFKKNHLTGKADVPSDLHAFPWGNYC